MRSTAVQAQPSSAQEVARILVVEDEFLIRMVVCDTLREAGLNVVEAHNADEAMFLLRSGVPVDLVLSDVRMPGSIDGLELLEHARQTHPELPVIIMSGHLAPHEALEKGAAHFLAKPCSLQHMLTLIEQELAKPDGRR